MWAVEENTYSSGGVEFEPVEIAEVFSLLHDNGRGDGIAHWLDDGELHLIYDDRVARLGWLNLLVISAMGPNTNLVRIGALRDESYDEWSWKRRVYELIPVEWDTEPHTSWTLSAASMFLYPAALMTNADFMTIIVRAISKANIIIVCRRGLLGNAIVYSSEDALVNGWHGGKSI